MGRIALAARGMNSGASSLRWAVCRGGSVVIIIVCSSPATRSPPSSEIRMFGDDENVAASRPTAFTSAYRVTAQNPGPSGSS